ncbi:hypothetical protein C0Q70_00292 [Pomacea canaliculata]|uniref:Hexosyltransferase n=1 Tax=Pomacea canaliculata TaxID=400727 RepID=A0A2T7PW97_POMCA|nr:beta-1,3-galactosyltransferase 4-like [Pomacea canaliculata]PVD37692.1 hypothetical protein C0Q70_00292 [Pomacea canaliculata]
MVILPPDDHLKEHMSHFLPGPQVLNDFSPGFFLISAPHVCGGSDSPSLVVVVPSVVYHWEIRAAIRATWGSPARGKLWPGHTHRLSVKLVFVFGVTDKKGSRDLHEESQRYGDIVQGDFHDNYRNLSIKTAAALQWSDTHCPGAKHVLKVDEDTFVNIPLLMEVLDYMSSLKLKFVLGHRHSSVRPRVARAGRWAVDHALYPFSEFPAYLYGHSYVVSRGAVPDLLFAFKRRPLMPNEDVLFTGVLASAMGVTRIHSHSFAHVSDRQRNATWCEEARGLRVSRTLFRSASAILNMWFDIILRRCHGDV